ncbi:PA14 domain-containing protein [Nocardia takedensis]
MAIVSVALVATLSQVLVFSEGPAVPISPREVPLLSSSVTEGRQAGTEFEESPADFVPLLADEHIVDFDPRTSTESGRTEFGVEYANSNGSRSVVLSPTPVSVADGRGGWLPVDTRLVPEPGSDRVSVARTAAEVSFADSAEQTALVRVEKDGAGITLALEGADEARREVTDSTVTYADALPGVDLKYEVTADSVKESLTLESAAAAGAGEWGFTLATHGTTPRLAGESVEFVDVAGAVVAVLPPVQVWDAAGSTAGGSYALEHRGAAWRLTVAVDSAWLTAADRQYPVVVDPTYTFGAQAETIAYQQGASACTFLCGIRTGNNRSFLGTNQYWRSAVRYNLAPLAGKTVTAARVDLSVTTSAADQLVPSAVKLHEATTPLGYGALGSELASATVGSTGSLNTPALIAHLDQRAEATDPNTWLMVAGTETNTFSYKVMNASLVVDYTDGGTPPPGPSVSMVAPVEDAIIATDTPTLEVAAGPAGTRYCFKISSGFDGRSGSVVDSGCLNTPRWVVPKYVLRDGGRYSWTVATTTSAGATPTVSNWVGHFTIDKRVGRPGPAPVDEYGPVTVNMFNGNLHTEAAGPVFEALGGSAGVTFAYNSRQVEDGRGVRASYFNDADHNGVADPVPVMVRGEAQVNLDWGNIWSNVSENLPWKEDPMPAALDDQWYVVRWEGYFRPSVTGDFSFAGNHTDGATIWIGDTVVYDAAGAASVGTSFNTPTPKASTDVSLTAGQRVPIKVELRHNSTGDPRMVLWTKSTTGSPTSRTHNLDPRIVPTEWLYSQDPTPLPGGWTLGLSGSRYITAEMLDGSVVVTDTAGGKRTWAKSAAGGYLPPRDEDGVLAVDGQGRISITDDGVVSAFNIDGTLAAVSNVQDSKKPASIRYLYSGTPARLTEIEDPVSGRGHILHYNTDNSDNCYGGAPFPPGAHSAPSQRLCRITYWDGTETRLWYAVGALARIENPGAEIRDYSYVNLDGARLEYDQAGGDTAAKLRAMDAVGPLEQVRDSLAVDWRAAQTTTPPRYTDSSYIEYDAFYDDATAGRPPHSRVVRVTAPAANGVSLAPRPAHSYRYDIAARKGFIDVAGLDTFGVQSFTWDAAGRMLSSTDAAGNTARTEWDAKDNPTARVDTAGRRTTLTYDHADRLVDEYGPAPASCFAGQLPTPTCATTMPHVHKSYDENLVGLEAAFYDNPYLAGVPQVWATGIGTVDGTLSRTWGSTPPVVNSAGWSGRFIGEVSFPAAGVYTLGSTVVDGVRLWIDDVLIIDSWTDKPSTTVTGAYTNTVADSRHRIRVDYYNRAGTTGALDLAWTPPGASGPVTVPGARLAPRYGLETGLTTHNTSGGGVERAPSKTVATTYADPANGLDAVYGLVASKTSDPGGLALTGRSVFEQPGQGFMRQLSASLAGGDITDIDRRGTSIYYGDNEARANPCVSGSPAVNQGGRVKFARGAKNSDGEANVVETVYNASGRIVAMRTNAEPWSCRAYDPRGRLTGTSFPAMGGQAGRTSVYDYAVGGDPLKLRVGDANGVTTKVVDLLGRPVSYTDVNGVVTTYGYDLAGRQISATSTVNGVSSTLNYRFDDSSRPTRVDLDGVVVATPGYTAGILTGVVYGNGSDLAITHNDAGSVSALAWDVPGSTVTSAVTRSRDQRVIDESVTDTAGATHQFSYTYDAIGRLTAATVPFHHLTYGYAGDGGCGPNPKAGRNTNRTSFSDSFNGAPAVTTTYCYDHADRLLSTSGGTALSFTYDDYGNALTVGTDTLGYDSTRRHVSTATAAGRSVTYARDVTDRIIRRTVQEPTAPTQVNRYGYIAEAGGPDFVLDASANLRQRVLKLPGGTVLTKNYGSGNAANWSYPNVHGDILFTADGTGTRTGTLHLYDPFGQNIDPATGVIGDIPIPATAEGGMDFGWLGQHTIPIEHVASQQALEMGERTYLPVLGRFLQTDPVPGGSANNYDYVNGDPVNAFDLTGRCPVCAVPLPVIGIGVGVTLLYGGMMYLQDHPIDPPKIDIFPSENDEKSKPAPATNPAPQAKPGSDAPAATPRELTAEEQKSIRSWENRKQEHIEKLEAYKADPWAYDNQGLLANAPNDEVRQRIIEGRIRHLEQEIQNFQDQIDRTRNGGK